MEIEVTRVTKWADVLNAARFTVGKEPLDKVPTPKFKKMIIRSEHSPLRLLEFDIKVYGVPEWVSVHFVRHHIGIEKFISTQRTDRTGSTIPRDQHLQGEPLNMHLRLNAQAIINISKVRLCSKASKETREVWIEVVNKLSGIEPELAKACVPSCIYRGFCPEMKPCGYINSVIGQRVREKYISNLTRQ